MLALYARLYLILFKAHKSISHDEELSRPPATDSQSRTPEAMANTQESRPTYDNVYYVGGRTRAFKSKQRLKKVS